MRPFNSSRRQLRLQVERLEDKLTMSGDPTGMFLLISPGNSNSVAGQPVTIQAIVSDTANSARKPTGTVTFSDEIGTLGTASLSGGNASLVVTSLPVGTHSITAAYGGDQVSAPTSQTDYNFVVSQASTSVVVSAPTSTAFGKSLTVTATVAVVSPGATVPSGTVTFYDGNTNLGSQNVGLGGKVSLTISNPSLGTHSITATYSGDASDKSTTSTSKVYVGDGLKNDFDGDGKADVAVYGKDPATGKLRFKVLTSSTNFNPGSALTFDNFGYGFGSSKSIPVPADYFGDGKSAYALWSPNNLGGMTFTAISSANYKSITVNFGGTNDVPVIADVDGDGKADFGVYGFQAGMGYRFDFLLSSKNFNANNQFVFNNNGFGYGNAKSIPVVADFDGSGKAGFGLFNPSASGSSFTYIASNGSSSFTKTIGSPNDIPSAVEYDGDGKSDLALYGPDPAKPGHYRYLVLTSGSGYAPAQAATFDNYGYGYGNLTSTPAIADYEGNGKADFGLFTPDNKGGMQYVFQTSQTGKGVTYDFATATDLPLTAPAFLLAKKVRGH